MNYDTKVKGLPTSVIQRDNFVQIWVSSPDGDSSDSQILEIRCADNNQAQQVWQAWVDMLGL